MKQNEPTSAANPTCDRCGHPVKSHSVLLCDACKGVVVRIAKDSPTLDEFAKRAADKGKEKNNENR